MNSGMILWKDDLGKEKKKLEANNEQSEVFLSFVEDNLIQGAAVDLFCNFHVLELKMRFYFKC